MVMPRFLGRFLLAIGEAIGGDTGEVDCHPKVTGAG